MNIMKKNSNYLKRRDFLKQGATLAAAACFMGSAGTKLFAFTAQNAVPTVTLNNGITMPVLGLGTNTLTGDVGVRSVADAIAVGYRLLDTATVYRNEEAVGAGIKQSGINREELFLTSKLWVDDAGYESARKAFQTSLNKLQTNYLDLYLIHRPRGDVKGSWKAMEELYREGKIKAIGVSNFTPAQMDDLMSYAKIKPTVNQIESNVFFQQHEAHEHLKKLGVQMEGWSPFAAGKHDIFNNTTLAAIAKKHNRNIAQVILRWHYQRGIVAIPRSTKKEHMIQNLDIWNFKLDDTDLKTIASMDRNTTQFPEWE
jgi:2,5-diketo-D-gluconate reductase A